MQCVSGPFPQTHTDRPVSTRIYIIQILQQTHIHYLWLVGLVVWFSLRVREVPGSTPGRAHQMYFFFNKIFIFSQGGSVEGAATSKFHVWNRQQTRHHQHRIELHQRIFACVKVSKMHWFIELVITSLIENWLRKKLGEKTFLLACCWCYCCWCCYTLYL